MSRALAAFVQRAATLHLPRFDAWFSPTFDWEAFCEDAPEIARRRGRVATIDPRLGELAGGVFRASHLVTLAVLAAGARTEDDPEFLLERLARPADEEEEEAFRELAERALGPVEIALGGEAGGARRYAAKPADEPADEAVERAAMLVAAVWPIVIRVLAEDEADLFDERTAGAPILGGVARVAAILAAFRWMAVERAEPHWPPAPGDGWGPEA